ncbi:MAG: response regulator [Candidatus Omnitrophota bacterium]
MEGKKILIAEDDAIQAEDLKEILEDLGYSVLKPVSKGDDAVRLAAKEKPDLVIMDIRLKGTIDGIEAAEKIRERYGIPRYGIPIIFLTAFERDHAYIQRAKNTIDCTFVAKPPSEDELQAAIAKALFNN